MPDKKKSGGKPANKTNSSNKKNPSRSSAKSRASAKKSGIDKRAVIAIVCIVVAAIVCLAVVLGVVLPKRRRGSGDGSARPTVTEDGNFVYRRQSISYAESTEFIDNPDQGFYRPIAVVMSQSEVNYNKGIVTDATRLYHLRIDISAFSGAVNNTGDIDITDNALDGLDGLFAYLRYNQKDAIVRFAYDKNYGGNKDFEPSMQTMLAHIDRLSAVLNRYTDMITAIEVGMFGPWGEMHSSAIATYDNIAAATAAFLEHVNDVPILVRTPRMIYHYLGITIDEIDEYVIDRNSEASRLGLFNDGYLGSSTDLGTYTDREREIAWLTEQTAHLPYGGEVVMPDSALHDIDNCTDEMFDMHLSYLNIEWNNQVIDKWKNTYYTPSSGAESAYYGKTAFDYIRNRMGYRFVVTDSVLAYSKTSDDVKLRLELNNVGFGNLTRGKQVTVYLVDEDGTVTSIGGGEYGGGELAVALGSLDTDKTYKVYVALHTGKQNNLPAYSVRFANSDMWSDELCANYVGVVDRN